MGASISLIGMYSSLEVIDLEDHVVVFAHPAGFRHLAEAGWRARLPLLVPAAMEVFEDSGALSDYVWETAGPECPFVHIPEHAFQVSGVTEFGAAAGDRLLGAFEIYSVSPLSESSIFVLAEVMLREPAEQACHLLYPATLVERFGVGTAVWGTFDRVRDIADLPTEQITASRHPNLIFRVVMALSRGDKELWELMLELGESASTIIGAVDLAVQDGIRIATVEGPPMRFKFYEPDSRATHIDLESSTGMGGKDVRGMPMDEPAYHSLLAILTAVMSTPSLMADEQLVHQTRQFLRLLSASAPRRVLAEHQGMPYLEDCAIDAGIEWGELADMMAGEPPMSTGFNMLLESGAEVDSLVLANLHRASQDRALLRVELWNGRNMVVEAQALGFSWSMERQLKGVDRATREPVKLKIAQLRSVEYLALPWHSSPL